MKTDSKIPYLFLLITLASYPFDHWNPFLYYLKPAEQFISLPEFFTVLTCLIWLSYIFILGQTQYLTNTFKSPVTICILIYLLVSLLSALNSYYFSISFAALLKRVSLFVLYLMIINIVQDRQAFRTIVTILAISAVCYVLVGSYELISGDMFLSEMPLGRTKLVGAHIGKIRIQGLETDPDLLSMVLLLLSGAISFMILSSKKIIMRLFWLFVFFSLGVNIIATGSRTGWACLFLLIAISFFTFFFHAKKLIAILMLLVFVATFSVMSMVPSLMVADKVKRFFAHASKDISVQERKARMKMSIDMARSYPFLGVGTGTSGKETGKYLRRGSRIGTREVESSISGFGTLLGDNGFLGFTAYIIMLSIILVEILINRINTKDIIWKNLGGSVLTGILIFIPCLVAYPSLGFRYAWILYALATSYAIISRQQEIKENDGNC